MEKNSEVIQTHPLVGWDISTVDSYDALMLRLHYQTPNQQNRDEAEVGQTLWLTTDVARQFISILEAGIAKIESGDYQENEYKRHEAYAHFSLYRHPRGALFISPLSNPALLITLLTKHQFMRCI